MNHDAPLSPATPRRKRSRAGAALALVALLLALLAVRVVNVTRAENIARDGCIYLQMARDLATMPAGEVMRSYEYHPGYSAAVSGLASLLGMDWPGGWMQVARGVSVGFSIMGLLAVYLVSRRAFDVRIAWVTVLLAGLSSTWMEVSCDVVSDAMAVSLAALGIALGLETRYAVRRQSRWSLVLAGGSAVASAGAYLTRPEGLLAALIAFVVLLRIGGGGLRRRERRLQLASVGILIVLTVACCLPYVATIGGITMKKSLSDFAATSTGSLPLASASLSVDLLSALRRGVDRLRAAAGTPMAVLCIAALATWVGRYWLRLKLPDRVVITPRRRSPAVAMFAPLAVLFPLLVGLEYNLGSPDDGYISSRHMLLPALLLSPLAGAAVAIFVQWSLHLGQRAGLKERPRLAWTCWTLVMTCVLTVEAFPVLHEGKGCHIHAGKTIVHQFGPGQCVLANNAWVPFFAEAERQQFVQVGGSTAVLRARHLADRDTLRRYVHRNCLGHRPIIAVSYNLLESTDKPEQTLAALRSNPDLVLLGVFPSAASEDDKIWLFRWDGSLPATHPSEP
jgi:hypothetical protein